MRKKRPNDVLELDRAVGLTFFLLRPPFERPDSHHLSARPQRKKYGAQSDVWSIGVIMFILLCGKPPFFGRSNTKIFKMILSSQLHLNKHFESDVWSKISPEAIDLIRCLLNPDPKIRFTPAQALAHPWVRVDGCAPDMPLDITLLSSMKEFRDYSKITKVVLRNLALTYSEEDIRDIREQFLLMDKDKTGTICMDELREAMQKASMPFGKSAALSREEVQVSHNQREREREREKLGHSFTHTHTHVFSSRGIK